MPTPTRGGTRRRATPGGAGAAAEAKEQLAGFFLIDCASHERAEVIAAQFAQPGGTVELRPVMWPGGDDQ